MNFYTRRAPSVMAALPLLFAFCQAQSLTPEAKNKVDAKAKQLQSWSTDPSVVAAVKAHNANPSPESKAMTNEKWKSLTLLDPFVRSFSKNSLAERIKSMKDASITEVFVSGADGTKVAFLSKTSAWSHQGKPKHDQPMAGKTYIGSPEVDESSGQLQVQIGLPVLDGGRPIGSIVVGLGVAKL